MSTSRNSFAPQLQSVALWNRIEEIYGTVPELVKVILEVNGFDTFLALKGIRYDDKKEFFESLEEVVTEILTSSQDSTEKRAIQKALGSCSEIKKFKLKPGYRNYIMNLMLEIDYTDSNHFFRNDPFNKTNSRNDTRHKATEFEFPRVQVLSVQNIKKEMHPSDDEGEEHFMYKGVSDDQTASAVIKMEKSEEFQSQIEPIVLKVEPPDEDEEESMVEEEEAVIAIEGANEGEFTMEEYIDAINSLDADMTDSYALKNPTKQQNETKKKYSKPEHMYNDEFMALKLNPRKRRITTSKIYPNTFDGNRTRFRDLIRQSMQCILTRDDYMKVKDKDIEIERESDTCWICVCPICEQKIKLTIHVENKGKYSNYKRSNFERHLRFKHCGPKKTKNPLPINLPSLPVKLTPKIVVYPSDINPLSTNILNNRSTL